MSFKHSQLASKPFLRGSLIFH